MDDPARKSDLAGFSRLTSAPVAQGWLAWPWPDAPFTFSVQLFHRAGIILCIADRRAELFPANS